MIVKVAVQAVVQAHVLEHARVLPRVQHHALLVITHAKEGVIQHVRRHVKEHRQEHARVVQVVALQVVLQLVLGHAKVVVLQLVLEHAKVVVVHLVQAVVVAHHVLLHVQEDAELDVLEGVADIVQEDALRHVLVVLEHVQVHVDLGAIPHALEDATLLVVVHVVVDVELLI